MNAVYSTTPSLKIEISRYPFCSVRVCFPEATSSTSAYSAAPASPMLCEPSAIVPALKSIQPFFLSASGVLVAIFSVGRGRRRACRGLW